MDKNKIMLSLVMSILVVCLMLVGLVIPWYNVSISDTSANYGMLFRTGNMYETTDGSFIWSNITDVPMFYILAFAMFIVALLMGFALLVKTISGKKDMVLGINTKMCIIFSAVTGILLLFCASLFMMSFEAEYAVAGSTVAPMMGWYLLIAVAVISFINVAVLELGPEGFFE